MATLKRISYSSAGKTIDLPEVTLRGLTQKEEREVQEALVDVVFQFGWKFAEAKRTRRGYAGIPMPRPAQHSNQVEFDF